MKRMSLAACVLWSALATASASAQSTSDFVVTRAATRTSTVAPAANFTGIARVETLFEPTALTRAYGASVAFEAGARTAWHWHATGQVLVVTAGVGRVQRWGGLVEEIRSGDVVRIPPGVKHWHGAAPATAMTHIAIVEQGVGRSTEWFEHVSDAQYAARPGAQAAVAAAPSRVVAADSTQSLAAQRLMGDIAPKLAQLTDSVLYGDVWARPGLSRRDRSLVTVSALIAMNRPDQLRSHLTIARQNGVTQEEAIEAITHLAFYAGWPNAVTAVGVARDVFTQRTIREERQ